MAQIFSKSFVPYLSSIYLSISVFCKKKFKIKMATLTQRPFVEIMKKIHSTARPTQDGNKNYFVDKENK